MKVILRENVSSLGNVGDIVNVSPGHARNYLVPNHLAVIADEANQKVLAHEQKRLAKKVEAAKKEAEQTKSKLDGIELSFTKRVAGNGTLFGAVSTSDISKALEEKGLQVEKRLIALPRPVKTTGEFEAIAHLFNGVESQFKIKVEMDAKQAEEIQRKQEHAAKKKKEQAEAKEAGAENTDADQSEAAPLTAEQTEQQRLDEETNKILRS